MISELARFSVADLQAAGSALTADDLRRGFRQARGYRGLSQMAVARLAHVNRHTVRRFEAEGRDLYIETFLMLASAVGLGLVLYFAAKGGPAGGAMAS
jgi:DNA-binding XRE family transcriptional regulator